MLTFVCYLNWTDQGAKAVKDAVKRYEATKTLIAGLGGRLVCCYVTTGQYDVVLVVEMPTGDAMTKLAVALTSRGNARTTTVRAFSPEEFGKLAAEAP
ncbi:MAG: GYD domain-containing protein [Rhodopila sp.]|nr:GYD domain-containing protein [Rhodopila sp.]